MEIGVVGKPNVGKSTFYSACTLAPAQIANYPFTTISPNRGVAYVRSKCPHSDFNTVCIPRNSKCENGIRLVPIEMIDVAGLVPDAHKGKGLGNKFLDDLRQASCLIHIVDASGCTDFSGNICEGHDVVEDVKFLEKEIVYWFKDLLLKDWKRLSKQIEIEKAKPEKVLFEKFAGLGITEGQISHAIKYSSLPEKLTKWKEEELLLLVENLRRFSKPMIIAANKCDIAPKENIEKLKGLSDYIVIPTSAESELALRRAERTNLIEYQVGSSSFKILDETKLNEKQKKALELIRVNVLERYGSTGVQQCIEQAVFKLLNLITVYPVEDENKLTDKEGRVLPDAFLLKKGSNAKDLAFKIHTDLGNNFIRAINVRTRMVIGANHELQDGDVIKIVANA